MHYIPHTIHNSKHKIEFADESAFLRQSFNSHLHWSVALCISIFNFDLHTSQNIFNENGKICGLLLYVRLVVFVTKHGKAVSKSIMVMNKLRTFWKDWRANCFSRIRRHIDKQINNKLTENQQEFNIQSNTLIKYRENRMGKKK